MTKHKQDNQKTYVPRREEDRRKFLEWERHRSFVLFLSGLLCATLPIVILLLTYTNSVINNKLLLFKTELQTMEDRLAKQQIPQIEAKVNILIDETNTLIVQIQNLLESQNATHNE